MFVILVYDVQTKRVGRIRKIAKKYLSPVQKSVFEGYLTESRINALKYELRQSIDPQTDSILIYRSNGRYSLTKEQLGSFPGDTDFIL